jgi:hypothetical protein
MARRTATLAIVLAIARNAAALAPDDFTLGASVTAGYRSVGVDGSEAKYREDYNLRSGGRLFDLDVDGVAKDPATSPLDRFHLLVDTPGDEPTSTFLLTAADRQRWDFRADFTRSKYFYAVPALFETPVPGDGRTDDLHDFDLIRTDGAVDFTLRLPNLPKVFVGYRLYRQEGDTTSTVTVPGGDTFLVRAPLDARTHVAVAGTELDVLGADVFVQQQYRRLTRDFGAHGPLPGSAAGLDPTDASTLTRYDSAGGEHVDEPVTTLRLRRPLGDRVEVSGGWFFSHAGLDSSWTTRSDATSDVPGLGGASRRLRTAHATLDTNVGDAGVTAGLTDGLAAHATYRFDEQAERGGLTQRDPVGLLTIGSGHHLRLHRLTGDLEWTPRRDVTLRAGLRYAWRLADFAESGVGPITTQTLGAIADARWRPSRLVDVFARYESAQVDDPYVVAGDAQGAPPLPGRETTLTFQNRGSAGATLRPRDWATLGYRFVADSRENASFGARSVAYGNSATVTLTPLPSLSILAAYTRRDLDNRADILIAPVYARTRALQQGSEDVLTTQATYDFGLLGQRWTAGCHLFYVRSDQHWSPRFEGVPGAATLFDLSRVDGAAFLTYRHPWIEPSLEVRVVDYGERVLPRNDYRATIVTVSFTRRFGAARTP